MPDKSSSWFKIRSIRRNKNDTLVTPRGPTLLCMQAIAFASWLQRQWVSDTAKRLMGKKAFRLKNRLSFHLKTHVSLWKLVVMLSETKIQQKNYPV